MDATAAVFLVLLGGTSAEHVIPMPSMEACQRAAQSVAQYECLTAKQYEQHQQDSQNPPTDSQVPPPDAVPSKATVTPEHSNDVLDAMPNATQRRLRDALYPQGTNTQPALNEWVDPDKN